MRTSKTIASELASLANDLKPLVEASKAGTITEEQSTRFDELVGQAQKAQEDLAAAKEREAKTEQMDALIKAQTEPSDPVSRDAVTPPVAAMKSIGRQFVESEAFKGRDKTGRMRDFFHTDQPMVGSADGEKALMWSGVPPTSLVQPQVLPTIYRGNERVSAIRQVLGSMRTTSDNVTIMRENVFTNAAAEVDESEAVDDASAVKPESGITFTQETVPVEIVAHWIPVTRQLLEDAPMMESYVDTRLRQGLDRRIANQLINGDGTPPNIAGLLDHTSLTVADGTYFSGAPVNDAGTDNENPNRLRRAKRLVRTTGLANPTFILANPADTEDWETLTTTDGQYLFGGPQVSGAIGRMWGLPVFEDEYIAAGTAIVGDGSMAAVVDRNDAQVYTTDSHDDFFIRNILVLLAEVRLTLAIFRPAAFVKVTLA